MMEGEFRRFIVLRKCPPWLPNHEGRWCLRPEMSEICQWVAPMVEPPDILVDFYPTGRYELREDGEKAEVFEPPIKCCQDRLGDVRKLGEGN